MPLESSDSLSEPDAQDEIAQAVVDIEASSRLGQKLLKADCLRRDGYRRTLTNAPDRKSVQRHNLIQVPMGTRLAYTECAHILPFYLSRFDESHAVQVSFDYHEVYFNLDSL